VLEGVTFEDDLGPFLRGASKKHMYRYLDELIYRFNRRWRETQLFGFSSSAAPYAGSPSPTPVSRLSYSDRREPPSIRE